MLNFFLKSSRKDFLLNFFLKSNKKKTENKMSFNYEYLQADFKNATEINTQQLHDSIISLNLTSGTFGGITVSSPNDTAHMDFRCIVSFTDNLLSGDEKPTLDATINNYTYTAPKTDTICFLKDIKVIGTNAGTFTQNTWSTRDLNTLVGNVEFCTLASNQFTLTEGSYTITAKAPACDVYAHQIRLQNITASSTETMGLSNYSTGGVTTYSDLSTIITVASTNVFEIQHICSKTNSNIGFGRANGWDEEVYTTVTIQKN